MIVFIEGPDGSGKSTLIARLRILLSESGRQVLLAPALWTFLEPITAPGEFGPWVRAVPGTDVAFALLAAMAERVRSLAALTSAQDQSVVLVDRGPVTVTCSALAHAKTGRPSGNPSAQLQEACEALRQQVSSLTAAAPCRSVQLRLPTGPKLVITRLSALEDLSASYTRYLRVLCAELATARPQPGMQVLVLDADASIEMNTAAAVAWLLAAHGS